MNAFVPCHKSTPKSASKSPVIVYQGMCPQPIRVLMRSRSACGPRETNARLVLRALRWAGWATWSATIEQPTQPCSGQPDTPASQQARYPISCVRPSNRSSRVAFPAGPSNSYSFSTACHGIRRRAAASASRAWLSSFSFTSILRRAASHSSADTIGRVFMASSSARRSSVAVLVLVVTVEPRQVAFVPAPRCPVEPLPHRPEGVEAPRVSGIRVVDDASLERERAHPGLFPGPLTPGDVRLFELGLVPVVVLNRRDRRVDRDVEVVVEPARPRRRPREAPAHAVAIRHELLQRRARDGGERDVVVLKVEVRRVEPVGDRGAAGAALVPVRVVHEVVHDQLGTAAEQIGERGLAVFGVEQVLIVDAHPRQLAPQTGELVVPTGQLLPRLEQVEPGFQPLLTRSGAVISHGPSRWCCHGWSGRANAGRPTIRPRARPVLPRPAARPDGSRPRSSSTRVGRSRSRPSPGNGSRGTTM